MNGALYCARCELKLAFSVVFLCFLAHGAHKCSRVVYCAFVVECRDLDGKWKAAMCLNPKRHAEHDPGDIAVFRTYVLFLLRVVQTYYCLHTNIQ